MKDESGGSDDMARYRVAVSPPQRELDASRGFVAESHTEYGLPPTHRPTLTVIQGGRNP